MRRGRFETMRDILDTCSKEPKVISRIMGSCNLSYTTVEKLITSMVEQDYLFITENGNRIYYHITAKGSETLKALAQLN